MAVSHKALQGAFYSRDVSILVEILTAISLDLLAGLYLVQPTI